MAAIESSEASISPLKPWECQTFRKAAEEEAVDTDTNNGVRAGLAPAIVTTENSIDRADL